MKNTVTISRILKCPLSYGLRIEEAPFGIFQRYELVNKVKLYKGKLLLSFDSKIEEVWSVKDLKKIIEENKISVNTAIYFRINRGPCYAVNMVVKNSEFIKYVNMIASGDHVKVAETNFKISHG